MTFKPGQSGNPAGRPPGARAKFSEAFVKALSDDFGEHGKTVIQACRGERPGEYLRVMAGLVPKALTGDAASIDLGDVSTTSGIVAAMNRIVTGVSAGELSIDQAKGLADLVEATRKAIETNDLEARLKAIEDRAGINGATSTHAGNHRSARQ